MPESLDAVDKHLKKQKSEFTKETYTLYSFLHNFGSNSEHNIPHLYFSADFHSNRLNFNKPQ